MKVMSGRESDAERDRFEHAVRGTPVSKVARVSSGTLVLSLVMNWRATADEDTAGERRLRSWRRSCRRDIASLGTIPPGAG
jgi:hypothetical protein